MDKQINTLPESNPGYSDLQKASSGSTDEVASQARERLFAQINPSMVRIFSDKGQGSGFFLESNGTIATDAHVVAQLGALVVRDADGKYHRARIEKVDELNDLLR